MKSRKSLRLKNYNYKSPNFYYITICTKKRKCILGDMDQDKVVLNELGKRVDFWLHALIERYDLELDYYVIMPNHIHFVLILTGEGVSLGRAVQWFKSMSANEYRRLNPKCKTIWQRGYYEHIIRNEHSLNEIREYIENNPRQWYYDKENPVNYFPKH